MNIPVPVHGRRNLVLALALLVVSAQLSSAAVTVTATNDDGVPAATKKNPGNNVTYTIQINSTGTTDATGVTFTDATAANTTEVAGSLNVTPLALDETYAPTVLANTSVDTSVSSGFNVLTNDYYGYVNDVALTASSAAVTVSVVTAPAHGTVTFNGGANKGTFVYTPTAGYTGADTFKYGISNGVTGGNAASTQATVTLNVGGPVIWYVNPNVATTGTGTLASPFKTLAEAITAIGTNTSQRIFVYSGGAAQSGNFILKASGWLTGQAAVATSNSFDTLMGISPPADTAARPTLNSAGAKPVITNSAGDTITLGEGNTILGVAITNTGGAGKFAISGASINAGTIGNATTSDVTIGSSGTSGGAISLITAGNGNFNINAPITTTAGRSVNIANRTAGTVAFASAISDTSTGISLATNTGATINFTGGLSLSTGANAAFTATGGGTVNATQNNTSIVNTLTATTGTALNVANTTIGANGLTFRSVTSTGGANGIVLNNTGTSGGLTVTGTSTTAGTGGTISNKTGNGVDLRTTSNVTLKNMNLTSNAQTQTVTASVDLTLASLAQNVANLYLSSVTNVSLTNLSVTGSTQQGILAISVAGFTLANSTIGGNGNQDYEAGLVFKELTGTVSVSNTNVQDNFSEQAHGYNSTGSLTLTVTGSLFGRTVAPTVSSQHGLLLELAGGSAAVDVGTTSFVKNGNGNGLLINLSGSATLGSAGTHSSIHNSPTLSENAAHVFVNSTGDAVGYFDVMNNSVMTKAGLQAIDYFVNPTSTAAGGITGVIQGNTIGTTGVAGSAGNRPLTGGGSDGMTIDKNGAGFLNLRIQSNAIQQVETNAIAITTSNSNTLAASITSNTIREPGYTGGGANAQGNALLLNVGAASGSTTNAYYTITGNTITDTAAKAWDINGSGAANYFNTKNGTVTNLPGYAGGATNDTNFANFVNANNTITLVFPGAAKTLATRFNGSTYGGASSPLPTPLIFAPGGVEARHKAVFVSGAIARNIEGRIEKNAASHQVSKVSARAPAPSSLTQTELDSIVPMARGRWAATGLTSEQLATLRALQFEAADLPGLRLGEADGTQIRVDKNAGGNGWFVGNEDAQFTTYGSEQRRYTDPTSAPAGRIDLLTAIMHEMGHALGLDDTYAEQDRDSLMYGYLTKGERRLPAKDQAKGATPHTGGDMHFLTSTVNIGTLPAGKSVVATYTVTITVGMTAPTISNQGTVSGSNFSNVLTDDATVGGATDPTVTQVEQPPAVMPISPGPVLEDTQFNFTAAMFDLGFSDPNASPNLANDTLQSVRDHVAAYEWSAQAGRD